MSWGSSTKPLWRAQPPIHFLMRAGSLAVTVVLSQAPSSDSNSCYYAIVRGKGSEKSRRENCERGEWGINRMRSNKMKANGKEGDKTQHNSEGSCALYSTTSTRKNEDQSQHLWLLYKDILKGGSTLKLGLSPLSSN